MCCYVYDCNLNVHIWGPQTRRANSSLSFIFLAIGKSIPKNFKPVKGSLPSSRLFVTSPHITNIFTHIFSKRQKSIAFYKSSISWLNWIAHNLLYFTLQLITKVMFILSSIFGGWLFWSVNHTLIYENSESKVFKNIKCLVKISNNWPNDL